MFVVILKSCRAYPSILKSIIVFFVILLYFCIIVVIVIGEYSTVSYKRETEVALKATRGSYIYDIVKRT